MSNRVSHIRLNRKPEVLSRFGFSNSTLYNKIQKGLFVPPVHLGVKTSCWPSNETDEIMAAVISGASETQLKDIVSRLIALRTGRVEDQGYDIEYQEIAQ